jgi:hypothetical protein
MTIESEFFAVATTLQQLCGRIEACAAKLTPKRCVRPTGGMDPHGAPGPQCVLPILSVFNGINHRA